jgi:hypothetical protein
MKPVPPRISQSAPEETAWFGGPVDRLTMSLRVAAPETEWSHVSGVLGCQPDAERGMWRIEASKRLDGNLDAQLEALLSRVSSDPGVWKTLASRWKVDIFCGVFQERTNRGISLSPESMRMLSERGIPIGFDIYSPDESQA